MCDLYPDELFNLHFKMRSMVSISMSLGEAEVLADRLLEEHLDNVFSRVGYDEYYRLLIGVASDDAKLLYALRCFIACSGIVPEPDKIEICGRDVTDQYLPVLGCVGAPVVAPDRDVLPWDMLPRFSAILEGFDLEVTCDNVWGLLSEFGSRASIHDNIVGRLLYLVENANYRRSKLIDDGRDGIRHLMGSPFEESGTK